MKSRRLHILVCSAQQGSSGLSVAHWVARLAKKHSFFECQVVELADFKLPVNGGPARPRTEKYEHESTKAWCQFVGKADAFVFVIAESDLASSAALIDAMSFFVEE